MKIVAGQGSQAGCSELMLHQVGFVAPAGTPAAVVRRFNEEINKAVRSPDLIERLQKSYAFAEAGTAEEFTRFLADEGTRWTKLVKDANIKAD